MLLLSLFQQTSIFHFAHIVNTVSFAVVTKNEKNNRLWQRNCLFFISHVLCKRLWWGKETCYLTSYQSIPYSEAWVTSLLERSSEVMYLATLDARHFFIKVSTISLMVQSRKKFMKECQDIKQNWAWSENFALHKRWSLPWMISSVNLTKSAGNYEFGYI